MSLGLSPRDAGDGSPPSGARAVAEPARPEHGGGPRGSDARLRAILHDHYTFIWRQLRRFGVPPSRVDDAAQEVFVIASQKLDSIREGSERSYLFGTALRVASQERRSASLRHEVGVSTPPETEAIASRPDELLDRGRARALLDAVLDSLDDELRTVLVLYEIEEMATKDIAELLAIPVGTVASRLRRAREAFEAKVARLFPKRGAR